MASEEDSYSTITLKGTPVAELRVTDMKRELEKRGLSKTGSKTQLIERLKAQLLLEKLQQDAAQSSGDELSEGKVPNIALQEDNKTGQSEFVRQYLQQQQKNLEIQMEVKKQVEEERKRKSPEESPADVISPANVSSAPAEKPSVTTSKKFKADNGSSVAKEGPKPRPARKSSRNASKGENGQEGEQPKEKSRSPTPEQERLRERTRSGSSSRAVKKQKFVSPSTPEPVEEEEQKKKMPVLTRSESNGNLLNISFAKKITNSQQDWS